MIRLSETRNIARSVEIDYEMECNDDEIGTATILVEHAAEGENRIIPGANHTCRGAFRLY